jgi:hypothetical protein
LPERLSFGYHIPDNNSQLSGRGLALDGSQSNRSGQGAPNISKSGWYTEEGYLNILKSTGASSALAKSLKLYANGDAPNNVDYGELSRFVGTGLSKGTTSFLLAAAQANANSRNARISGQIDMSSFNVEDIVGVGILLKEGTELLAQITARNILSKGLGKLPDLYVRVGHWSPLESYNLMKTTGKVVEEGTTGHTFFAINGPTSWAAAPKGWVYSEMDVRTKDLIAAGNWDWWQAIFPNANSSMQKAVLKQGGDLAPSLRNLSPILQIK